MNFFSLKRTIINLTVIFLCCYVLTYTLFGLVINPNDEIKSHVLNTLLSCLLQN